MSERIYRSNSINFTLIAKITTKLLFLYGVKFRNKLGDT